MNITPLFCEIDDSFLDYEKQQLPRQHPEMPDVPKKPRRPRSLHVSEVMTLLIVFHQSQYRTLKHFYQKHVCRYWRWAFPKLVSYNRFVELIPDTLLPLTVYLSRRMGKSTGIAFIDSTPMAICENRRIQRHHVFHGIAERGKNSIGWFYSFKLHLVINENGELLRVALTPANTDDRSGVAAFTQGLFGKLYADKHYISKKLVETLKTQGICLITKKRKNMKPEVLSDFDARMLRNRMVTESVINQLKNQCQCQHTRHRSCVNFQVNAISALIAYTYQEKKPSLNIRVLETIKDLPVHDNS